MLYPFSHKDPEEDDDREDKNDSWWPAGHIKEFLIKGAIQAVIFVVLWFISFFLKKNWNVRDYKLREYLHKFHRILEFIPRWDEGYAESISRGEELFNFVTYEKESDDDDENLSWEEEIKLFVAESNEKYTFYNDGALALHIIPLIADKAKITKLTTIGVNNWLQSMEFVDPVSGLSWEIIASAYLGTDKEIFYNRAIGITKGFTSKNAFNQLFEIFGNQLTFSFDGKNGAIRCKEIDYKPDPAFIMDEKLYSKLNNEIAKCKALGIQRSYIFYGEPGAGKTVTAKEIMRRAGRRAVQLTSDVFCNLAGNHVQYLLDHLEVDAILVDDIDRISISDMAALLNALERFKSLESKPTLIATVNSIQRLSKAIIRPGRFDRIFEFKLLEEEERADFIKKVLVAEKIENVTEAQITQLAECTSGMTQAYLREYCLAFKVSDDFEGTIETIKQRAALLEDVDMESFEEV